MRFLHQGWLIWKIKISGKQVKLITWACSQTKKNQSSLYIIKIFQMNNLEVFAAIACNDKNATRIGLKKIQRFIQHGITSQQMQNASYPETMTKAMKLYENINGTSKKTNYELVNYYDLEWYTSSSPQVVCPKCNGHFTLTSKSIIRKHSCSFYQAKGPPCRLSKKKTLNAPPSQYSAV